MKSLIVTVLVACVSTSAVAETARMLTLPQARAAALRLRPGKVVKQELEREKGGSGLRYTFDIRVGRVTYEVGVDAKTGRILENGKA